MRRFVQAVSKRTPYSGTVQIIRTMMDLTRIVIILCLSVASAKKNPVTGNNGIGHFCEREQPCQNGGTCGYTRGGYICKCPPGYQGYDCQQAVDACADSPCNQGTCENTAGSYTCICPSGWTGTNCQTATSRVVICAGGRMLLRCEPGEINIVQVLFGRTDASICSLSSSAPTSTDCELSTADAKVRSECEGETSCYVLASSSFFRADPCTGTTKYLSVEYQCV
uniref:Delta-like protein C isoform X2 n=1 Tax=Crassostrea virginica TaxID=6565 RepID=A0A8B8C7F2_CRAVI|nr:delta-like protein C isoform X2 [Crassostrea virginica]